MSNKILIIILAIILLFMIMMGAGFFIMWNKMSSSIQQPEAEIETIEEEPAKESIGPIFSLGTFIVNLSDDGGKRYLRVSIDIELSGEELKAELEKRLPQIKDNILMIMPSKTFNSLNSAEGKTALRNELLLSINEVLNNGSIMNIYFTEFVIQ
jgi:flagellar FliL protein